MVDGRIIANTSTHEMVTSLELMDFGYLIVIGREDGHVITMKLMDPEVTGYEVSPHPKAIDRRDWVLGAELCSLEDMIQIHSLYRPEPQFLDDVSLPRVSDNIEDTLRQKARVPHAIIHTRRSLASLDESERLAIMRGDSLTTPSGAVLYRGESTSHSSYQREDSVASASTPPRENPTTPNSPKGFLQFRAMSEPRGSLSDIFSPAKVLRSPSGLFQAFAEFAQSSSSSESKNKRHDS